jgi:hypothetical protein
MSSPYPQASTSAMEEDTTTLQDVPPITENGTSNDPEGTEIVESNGAGEGANGVGGFNVDGEIPEPLPRMTMDEVNFLVYSYLKEAGELNLLVLKPIYSTSFSILQTSIT